MLNLTGGPIKMQNNWTPPDTKQLIKMYKINCDLESMTRQFPNRNESTVKAKLVRLGYSVKGL